MRWSRSWFGGDEFIMDVQSHHIDQSMEWRDPVRGDWSETNKLSYTFFCSSFDGSAAAPTAGADKLCAAATPDRFPSWIDPSIGIEEVVNLCRGELDHAPCLGLDDYIDLMLRRSDTTVAVLKWGVGSEGSMAQFGNSANTQSPLANPHSPPCAP